MSSKLLSNCPRDDGFIMPAEYEPQAAVWLLIGGKIFYWPNGGFKIRATQVDIARAILSAGTKVLVGVTEDLYLEAEHIFAGMDVSIFEMTLDNCWPRDSGAITVKNRGTGEVRGVDFRFNGWGGEYTGAMASWVDDNLVARKMLQYTYLDRYKTSFTLEGGAINTDGEGTVITTASCLLNKNRNPGLGRAEIEENLRKYLGFEKVIWLKEGIDCGKGGTDGHVDNICAFIGPAEVVCCYTEDKANPFHAALQDAYRTLCESRDAKGRKLNVHKLTACKPFYFTKEEANNVLVTPGVGQDPDGKWRKEGDAAVPSYANFLITNGTIVFPVYGVDSDAEAVSRIKEIVADRYRVVPVNAHEIALGGGSIHCFTQQVSQ